jgi:hypothetical protein
MLRALPRTCPLPLTHAHVHTVTLYIAPTLLHVAAGVDPAKAGTANLAMDGRSILSLEHLYLSEDEAVARDGRAIFVEMERDRAVVTQGHKYIKKDSYQLDNHTSCRHRRTTIVRVERDEPLYPSADDENQLYDLVSDPSEQVNIAEDAGADQVLRKMQSHLDCHVNATALGSPEQFLACGHLGPVGGARSLAGAGSRRGWSTAPARARPTAPVGLIASLVLILIQTL